MSEPFSTRWRRRAVTIPTMLGATAVAIIGLPLLLPAAALVDLLTGRLRFPTIRLYLFLLQYLVNDTLEIIVAPLWWAVARVGTGLDSAGSRARHQRLQDWSARTLARRADQLLGLPIAFGEAERAAMRPGPIVVISRHVSLFDASLPGLILERLGFRVRAVILAELLADPGFDLIYNRTGSVFISRDDGEAAVAAIEAMAIDSDENTALIIFPEGRLYRPAVRDRLLAKLAETDPVRAERLGSLRNVLPPRPGGLFALLDAVPAADVVLIDHRGFDRFQKLADLARAVPVGEPIAITARRIPRSEIPSGRANRAVWLDELWLALDAGLGGQGRAAAGPDVSGAEPPGRPRR